jgi:hypothetical protein
VPSTVFPIAWQQDRLIVAEAGRHQIHAYTREGKLISQWGQRSRELDGFAGCCNPVSLVPLNDGTLVTAERGQPRVKAFSAAGRLSRLIAGPERFEASRQAALQDQNELAGCQAGILDLALSPNGAILVLDRTTREIRIVGQV